MSTAPTFRLMPLPKEAKIPKGRQHTGFFYRMLNRRMQLTLRADGKVSVVMRRLLTREEAQICKPQTTPTQTVRGRLLDTSLVLTMEAVAAFVHFAGEIIIKGTLIIEQTRPVHGVRLKAPRK